ncbi:MAG TPA: 4-hydroxy-3-methylbut-2-enyl diphosphate reductase, partial [Casimicrobiaceae bacterium]|nr:4-hydroxy-3-methylbut-2-enyl diphosphate reductase [Casimicrobiaceae bacterium]
VPAYMVDSADELRAEWIAGKRKIGLTAGASAPEVLVSAVIERLRAMGADDVRELAGVVERIVFPMPKGLTGVAAVRAPEVGPPIS